jgi:spore maturation protein A
MLGKCFFALCSVSLICAVFTGRISEVSCAVLDGAQRSVTLILSLAGIMCLWSGALEVFTDAGLIGKLSRVMSPILRIAFPNAWETGCAKEEITAAVSANILGVGNAATPFALSAMDKMQRSNPNPDCATDDMVTLSVLATSSVSLLPTTVIALRRSAGAAAPYSVIIPVWITSVACAVFAVALCRLTAPLTRCEARRQIKDMGNT